MPNNCLSVCLSVCLSTCLSVCLYLVSYYLRAYINKIIIIKKRLKINEYIFVTKIHTWGIRGQGALVHSAFHKRYKHEAYVSVYLYKNAFYDNRSLTW